jgi:hypothetical protein
LPIELIANGLHRHSISCAHLRSNSGRSLLVGFAGARSRRRSRRALPKHPITASALPAAQQRRTGQRRDRPPAIRRQDDTELCLVHAMAAWRQATGITEGPVFRGIWVPAQKGVPPGAPPTPASDRRRREHGAASRRSCGRAPWWPDSGALTTGMDRGVPSRQAQATQPP